MGCPHTIVQTGKRVLVILKNGESFVAKFKEKSSKTLSFFDHGRINKRDLSSMTIYRERVRK